MRRRRCLLGALLTVAAGLPAGCKVPGMLLANLAPRNTIEAKHEPGDRTTAVLIDDRQHRMSGARLRHVVADQAADLLKKNEVITDFVPPRRIDEVRMNERDFPRWPIDKVGRRVGAEQVLFVTIDRFRLAESRHIYKPEAACRVKLVDVATGERLFPKANERGHPVKAEMFYKDKPSAARGAEQILARKLSQRLGRNVARLFFNHEPREVGSGFPE